MKILLNLTALILLGVANWALAAGDASKGKELTAMCAACHGADGNNSAPSFPKLAGLGEKYLAKQLLDIQSGSRAVAEMSGLLNGLSAQQLRDMAAYYASQSMQLSGAKETEVQVSSGESVNSLKLGEEIYRNGNLETRVPACTGCHSPRGLGNAPAGYPRLSGQHAQYTEKQLRDWRAGNRRNDGDSKIMRQVAEHMSDAEIIAVSNYIAGLN